MILGDDDDDGANVDDDDNGDYVDDDKDGDNVDDDEDGDNDDDDCCCPHRWRITSPHQNASGYLPPS